MNAHRWINGAAILLLLGSLALYAEGLSRHHHERVVAAGWLCAGTLLLYMPVAHLMAFLLLSARRERRAPDGYTSLDGGMGLGERCPGCGETLLGPEERYACERCREVYHAACVLEAPRCGTATCRSLWLQTEPGE